MKQIFYIAGGLLGVSGILHLAELAAGGSAAGAPAVILGLFGLTYLVIAYFLSRRSDAAVTAGMLAPIFGLLAAVLGLKSGMAVSMSVTILIDIIVIAISSYLYITGRVPLKSVR